MDSPLRLWMRSPSARSCVAMLLAVVCVGASAVAFAQEKPSLGELARREAERRKAIKTPSKVFTDKDVRPAPPRSVQAEAESSPAPGAVPQDVPAAADQKTGAETRDQAWWKNRIDGAREELRRAESFHEALQSRVNALTTDFAARDDPYQRAKIGDDRQKALAEMARVSSDVDRLKKAIADIEEEARRGGVPPGWLR